jgi:hypothetical protein
MSGLRQTDCWRGGRTALCTAMLATLLGCRAPQPRATVQGPAPAAPPALHQDDDSYDWHDLVIAPFGSALKDIPMELHEVLLFRDEAHSGAAVDDAECYGADATPPRFVGRTPDEYMLCFKQDRLSRIQASVRLTKAQAPEVFAAACAAWLKHAALATTVAGGSGAEVQSVDACEGRDGAIRFSSRLGEELGRVETPRTDPPPTDLPDTVLSIILDEASGMMRQSGGDRATK